MRRAGQDMGFDLVMRAAAQQVAEITGNRP